MVRFNESARPPRKDVAELRDAFWSAPDDALLDRKTVAAGLNRSLSWLEQLATKGSGPAFMKVGTHRVLYKKREIVEWFNHYVRRITSTSELQQLRPKRHT